MVGGVQFGDLIDFVDFDYTARVAKVNGAALWALATAPATPKNLQIHTTPPGTLAGTNVTTVTLDMSKDNVQFGLRAMDGAGHRSPVAFPQIAA